MKYLNLESNDVYTNLATEEYFLKQKPMELFMLWINDECIVIGKNQNSHKEINKEYVDQNNIKVVRRLTGGGAVFHDKGNLNFTFIKKNAEEDFLNFELFTKPVVLTLEKLGIKPSQKGRNDIYIGDKKFSGNAQCIHEEWLLHHGTIMFSVITSHILKGLNPNKVKLKAKGVESSKVQITNIIDHLEEKIDIYDFRENLIQSVLELYPDIEEYVLTKEDIKAIEKLRKEKYSTWEHNYGKNPSYQINNVEYISNVGLIDVMLNVENGNIKEIKIQGDFFSKKQISFVEEKLLNVKHDEEEIIKVLESIENFSDYFGELTTLKLAQIICS